MLTCEPPLKSGCMQEDLWCRDQEETLRRLLSPFPPSVQRISLLDLPFPAISLKQTNKMHWEVWHSIIQPFHGKISLSRSNFPTRLLKWHAAVSLNWITCGGSFLRHEIDSGSILTVVQRRPASYYLRCFVCTYIMPLFFISIHSPYHHTISKRHLNWRILHHRFPHSFTKNLSLSTYAAKWVWVWNIY